MYSTRATFEMKEINYLFIYRHNKSSKVIINLSNVASTAVSTQQVFRLRQGVSEVGSLWVRDGGGLFDIQ